MPDLTGNRMAAKMHQIRPDLPIILCSGFSEIVTEQQARKMGIREYLKKPVIGRELAKAIRRVLEEKPPTNQVKEN
jgi:FixJ family two-component response regulator